MRSPVTHNKRTSKRRGYSLIELCIATLISGFVISSISVAYNLYTQNKRSHLTINNASLITAALNNYLIQTGSYPCPAPMDVPRSDPHYGFAGNCADTSIPVGTCSQGYCVQQSTRSWGAAPPPAGWTGRVRRGAVPFRSLDIPEFISEDGYQMRYAYAVTEALAVQATYNRLNGGIDVLDANGIQFVKPPDSSTGGSVHYIIISSGPDRAGTYTHEGNLKEACPALGGTLDAQNCQTAGTQAVYRVSDTNTVSGPQHFDDIVKYYSSVETPLWRVRGTGGFHLDDLVSVGPTPVTQGKVGIGMEPVNSGPIPLPVLQIAGSAKAEQDIHTSQLCPSGSGSVGCYAAAMDLNCGPGEWAAGFEGGHMKCVTEEKVMCRVGEIMTGIDANGNIICTMLAGCPSTTTDMCWNAATSAYDTAIIPPGYMNQDYTTPVFGASFTRTFHCGVTGNWVETGDDGVCECIPLNGNYSKTCKEYKGSGCSHCWTGSATFYSVTSCPAGTTSSSYVSDDCVCTPYTRVTSSACPFGFTGSNTTAQDWICDSATAGHWGPVVQTGTCTCAPITGSQTISCQTAGYSNGYTGSVTQTRTHACPADTWSDWVTTTDTCTCTGATEYQTVGCPAPQVGNQDQSRTFDCVSNTWNPWVTYNSTCGAVVYTWRDISTQEGPYPGPLSIHKGDTCNTSGDVAPCSVDAGGGQYWHFSQCQCQ